MFRRIGRGPGGIAPLLLFAEVMRFGFHRIPPVTLITLAFNVAVFMGVIFPLMSVHGVCISVETVWFNEDWRRLVLAPFFHAGDMHLYYNMVSLLWKGSTLEKKYGSVYFAYLIAVFTVAIHALMVALNVGLYEITEDTYYIHSCAVGFSGVLFALKVLMTHHSPAGTQYIMGILPVPSKWIFWAELLLIQLLVPNASFVGHLAGILVGLAFVKGPLKTIMDMFAVFLPVSQTNYRRRGRSYTYHTGSTGRQSNEPDPAFQHYTGGLSEEDQMQWALNNSAQTSATNSRYAPYPEGTVPYPERTAPYPETSVRYPESSAPYPERSAPYPERSVPYPERSAPYPEASAPYPEESAPYPEGSAPYPERSAPYPETSSMPQPTTTRQSNNLYPNLEADMESLRQRRLLRFS